MSALSHFFLTRLWLLHRLGVLLKRCDHGLWNLLDVLLGQQHMADGGGGGPVVLHQGDVRAKDGAAEDDVLDVDSDNVCVLVAVCNNDLVGEDFEPDLCRRSVFVSMGVM